MILCYFKLNDVMNVEQFSFAMYCGNVGMCQNNVCPSKVRDKIVSNTQKVTYRKEKNNSTLSLFSLKVFVILPGKGSGIFQLYRRFLTFFVQVPQRDFCLACEAVWHLKSLYISHVVNEMKQENKSKQKWKFS